MGEGGSVDGNSGSGVTQGGGLGGTTDTEGTGTAIVAEENGGREDTGDDGEGGGTGKYGLTVGSYG